MAIQDLTGGGQQEGERVQTSNISNIPERVAILLADGYVEKQKYRIQKEAREQIAEYRQLCERMSIVETAMRERMDTRTRAVFRCLFIDHKVWSAVRDEHGNRLEKKAVLRCKNKIIAAIAQEIMAVEMAKEMQ